MESHVRIIAGEWRSRKILFEDSPGLRPTPNRVRETLFNWLTPFIPRACCLDLFAGSGALGIEAASRGAERVIMVEKSRSVSNRLQENISRLGAESIALKNSTAKAYLQTTAEQFHLVFLDPPFKTGLLDSSLKMVTSIDCLFPESVIYLEYESEKTLEIPEGWFWYRQKKSGDVGYGLLKKITNREVATNNQQAAV